MLLVGTQHFQAHPVEFAPAGRVYKQPVAEIYLLDLKIEPGWKVQNRILKYVLCLVELQFHRLPLLVVLKLDGLGDLAGLRRLKILTELLVFPIVGVQDLRGDPRPAFASLLRLVNWLFKLFNFTSNVAVYVDQCISCFLRVKLAAKSFLHYLVLKLHGDHVVVEAPPDIEFSVENEAVVVALLGLTIVNYYCMERIRQLAVVGVRILDLFFHRGDFLPHALLLHFDGSSHF